MKLSKIRETFEYDVLINGRNYLTSIQINHEEKSCIVTISNNYNPFITRQQQIEILKEVISQEEVQLESEIKFISLIYGITTNTIRLKDI